MRCVTVGGPQAKSLEETFCFLEEEVQHGRLRHYGVSTNHGLDLDRVVAAAARTSPDNHLRIIQFPLNLLERDAVETALSGW